MAIQDPSEAFSVVITKSVLTRCLSSFQREFMRWPPLQIDNNELITNISICTYHALTNGLLIYLDMLKTALTLVGGIGFEPMAPGV